MHRMCRHSRRTPIEVEPEQRNFAQPARQFPSRHLPCPRSSCARRVRMSPRAGARRVAKVHGSRAHRRRTSVVFDAFRAGLRGSSLAEATATMSDKDPWDVIGRQQVWIASSLVAIDASVLENPEWSLTMLESVSERVAHLAHAEERIVHPRLRVHPSLRPWIEAAHDGHDSITVGFEEVLDRALLHRNVARWRASFSGVRATLHRHFQEERTYLYAGARVHLSPSDAQGLGLILGRVLSVTSQRPAPVAATGDQRAPDRRGDTEHHGERQSEQRLSGGVGRGEAGLLRA